MEETICGFESQTLMGLIIGGMIASVGFSLFKNDKPKIEKRLRS